MYKSNEVDELENKITQQCEVIKDLKEKMEEADNAYAEMQKELKLINKPVMKPEQWDDIHMAIQDVISNELSESLEDYVDVELGFDTYSNTVEVESTYVNSTLISMVVSAVVKELEENYIKIEDEQG
tara:strand:+ start:107 stop:487 length:381 start_codon:yes stop_codon:yes gene_type:complete